MRKITLFLFFSIITGLLGYSQQVVIGTDTTINQGLPIDPWFGYSYSQIIYLQSEIGAAKQIDEISYAMVPTSSISSSNDWVIYMGHTAKTQFDTMSDWIDISSMTQVFSGVVSVNSGVVSIQLDTPFSYNGTDNLVIAVDENTSGYNSNSDDFYVTSVSNNRGILYRNDTTNPDPATPPSATSLRTYIANIVLSSDADCRTPSDVAVSPTTSTDASVSWTDNNTTAPVNWEYELVNLTAGGTATGTPTATFATNPAVLSGLVAGTDYEIYIRSVCVSGSSYSAWSTAGTWHQPLPGEACIQGITATINADCSAGTAVKYTLDFSQAQNQGATSCSNGNDVYGYWFDLVVTSTLSLRINNDATAGSNIGLLVNLDCTPATELTCEMMDSEVNVTEIDPGTYHALFWSTSQADSTVLCFEEVPCMAPQDIESDYIGYNSANFHWDISSSATSEWEVVDTSLTVVASGSTANDYTAVTGLSPETSYTFLVRSDCGSGTYSDWSELDFRTTIENDRPDGAFPLYLDIGTSCGASAITGISNAGTIDSGVAAPSCGSYGTPTERGDLWYVFTAPFDTVTLNVENISGMASVAGAYYSGTPGSLVEEGCTELSIGWPWELSGLNLGENYYLRVWDYGNDQDGTFDLCGYYESCPAPSGLTIDSYTNTEVTFSWTDNAGTTDWAYDVRPSGNPPPDGTDDGIFTNTNPTTDTGLTPDTTYDVYVRADCDTNGDSTWVGPATFTTYSDEAADWNNLQWPPNGTIEAGTNYAVYAQIYESGLTDADPNAPGAGISAWIGYSTTDTDPATWTNWIPATYNLDVGNNDEFSADIGPLLAPGNYFYASRFKINNGMYTYGGLNGFWSNDSGTLTVTVMENDVCDGAVQVTDLPYNISQDATYATNIGGFVTVCSSSAMNDGVWYTFTVATAGDITITVNPDQWDAELGVYSGACDALVCVDRSDSGGFGSTETVTFTATAGETYFVNIGYWNGSSDGSEGPFDLDITTSNGAVLGIDQNHIDGFVMYPNPVLDVLSLSATTTIRSIAIYNMLGQEVVSKSNASTNTQIDLSNLPSGSYIVRIVTGEQQGSYPLIKQ